MTHTQLDDILSEIQTCFSFLFERGFKIGRTDFRSDGMWLIMLTSTDFDIRIASDRLAISLAIARDKGEKWFHLFEIVYFLSDKKEFIGVYEERKEYKDVIGYRADQFQRFAKILYKYLNEITVLFGENSEKTNDELQSIRKEAGELHTVALRKELDRMKLL